ncbi:ATP-binding protein [Virgibacillus sp. W0181]|uniref:sensor histidine kinase n=1 Tax=Virgibacillus sp. W0181 TaxID=3391581 RepID=UPI003F486F8A
MRTLYVRIIVTTMGIMVVSAIIAFIVTNVYYQHYLKPVNDQKVTQIAQSIVSVFEENENEKLDTYLQSMADLGYQFYVVDQDGNDRVFGKEFRSYELESRKIETVLAGEVYHGISNFAWKPFVTGFFDNEVKNTIGVPIQADGEVQALFVRPNTLKQFGEMRQFLAVMLVLMLLFSFLFVLWSTRHIIKPIRQLTRATRKIAAGNYHIKLNEKRRDEIGRLANDFTKMSDSLSRIEEKRQEFVSNVSHEIQSPLTSIQGFSRALQEDHLAEDERQRYVSIIERESKRLSLLSKQLLTLSYLDRIENYEKVTFDLYRQLREVVTATEWHWREKEIAVVLDIPSTMIKADPKLLYQVWMNLITNAVRYTPAGGTITITMTETKSVIDVFIEDTGVGIAAEDLTQIFERFYKVDKARTRTETSTGLGLSITKKIIELHGGTIVAESTLGQGSAFQVTLPK